MTFLKFFTVITSAISLGVLGVALFGILIPSLLSAASYEMVGLGIIILMVFLSLIAANLYLLITRLRSKS